MVRQNWLLFSALLLLNTVTDAIDQAIITATSSHNGNLGKCQSCLTDIAGVERLSLASNPTLNLKQVPMRLRFQASGNSYSFMRAELDCQSDRTCGLITVEGLKPTNNGNAGTSEALCVFTDVQTSYDCGICLKMTSGSHSIQKFQLRSKFSQELHLHVLHTQLRDNFTPCENSGVCSGSNIEVSDAACNFLVKKLSSPNFDASTKKVVVEKKNVRSGNTLYQSVEPIYGSLNWNSECYQVFATIGKWTKCLSCIAQSSSGIAVLCNVGTFKEASGRHSRQLISLVSKVDPRKGHSIFSDCVKLCGSIIPTGKNDCTEAFIKAIDFSPSVGKIYANMQLWYNEKGIMVPDDLPLSQISSCLWIEHEPKYADSCMSCLYSVFRETARKLSPTEFLVLLKGEWGETIISQCISFGSSPEQKLCKKMTIISEQFCRSFESAPRQSGAMAISHTSATNSFHPVIIGRPITPTLECFTCLTSELDILITNLHVFWMVAAPTNENCLMECGVLHLGDSQSLDVSSIRSMSSDSVRKRFDSMEADQSHSFAGNARNHATQRQRKDEGKAAQNEGAERDANAHYPPFLNTFMDGKMLN